MYINTLNGLNEVIKVHPYCESRKQETYRKRIVDKSNLLVHFILEKNKHIWEQTEKTESAPLHSTILKSQLGRDYKEIVNILIELDIIQRTSGYKKGEHSIKYRITDNALNSYDIIKAGVLCKKTASKLADYKLKMLKSYIKHPIHKDIIHYITDVKLVDFENGLEGIKFETEDAERVFKDSYVELKQYSKFSTFNEYLNSSFRYLQDSKGNRVHNSLTNIPKQLRRRLRTKTNEQLTELDLTNAQPLIIFSMFLKTLKQSTYRDDALHNNNKVKEYKNRYLNRNKDRIDNILYICGATSILMQSYQSFGESLLNDTFYDNFRNKAIELGFSDIDTTSRNSVKKYVLKALYCYPNKELNSSEKVLRSISAGFLDWIRSVKIQLNEQAKKDKYYYTGNKLFAWIIQNKESDIFINNFFSKVKKGTFAFPIHDAIVCKVEDAEYVKSEIAKSFIEEFSQFKEQTILNIIKQKDYV